MNNRRTFLKQASMAGIAGLLPVNSLLANDFSNKDASESWSDGSRLVVSVSMQFEAGGQPENAESPFPQNMQKGFTDIPGIFHWYSTVTGKAETKKSLSYDCSGLSTKLIPEPKSSKTSFFETMLRL